MRASGKRIVWVCAVLVAAVTLSGCMKENMQKIMSSWEGTHIEQVIAQWGYPDEDKQVAGHHLFVWHNSRTIFLSGTSTTRGTYGGGFYNGHTTTSGGGPLFLSCTRTLEVDANGYVVRWEWQGNDCPDLGDNGWTKKNHQ